MRPETMSCKDKLIGDLKARREALGWSVKEVGDRTGLDETVIAQWERGDVSPRLDAVANWASALGLTLSVTPAEDEARRGLHVDWEARRISVDGRGAMTLHQLRLAVGDADFFEILDTWTTSNAGGHVATADFVALSEDVSGQQLDELFETWLFTDTKPVLEQTSLQAQAAAGGGSRMLYANLVRRLEARQR